MDIQSLVLVLWRRKWIVISVSFFAVCCALVIRIFGEWQYKSTAQLSTGITIADDIIDKGKYFNPYEIQITFNNLIETIKSRTVLGQVSYQLALNDFRNSSSFRNLDKVEDKEILLQKLSTNMTVYDSLLEYNTENSMLLDPNDPLQKDLEEIIKGYKYDYESILENLTINRLNQSDFIEISFLSEDPHLSAYVVNTICEEFIRYYTTVKLSRSNVSLVSLESIVGQRKEYLDEKMEELKKFKSNNEYVSSGDEGDAKIRQLQSYENQIASERQKIRGFELTLSNLNSRIQRAELATGPNQNARIVTLRRQINSLNERYIQGGQSNSALLDSISILRKDLDGLMKVADETPKISSAELSDLKQRKEETTVDLQIARENLTSLDNIYNSLRYSMGDLASKEAVGKSLEKEVDVAREEYLQAQNRLSEAREKVMTNQMSIVQVLKAEASEKPESRKTIIFMLFSGVLGFMLSGFTLIVLEVLDNRIKNGERFKSLSGMKLAGILPQIENGEPSWELFVSSGQDLSGISDSIRKIRFEIDNLRGRVLLVTSTQLGQGKSFFILALAYSLSLLKKRTLIIDTNLRNNSLTKMLTARPNLSLMIENFTKETKLLSADSEATEDEAKNITEDGSLINKTQNAFIDIIGNKTSALSPSEVIPKGDFKVMLEWFKGTYDYIILEGANLNEFSDTKELDKFVDLVIPVFSADSTISRVDQDALEYLKSLNEKLGPAVLNNVKEFK